MSIMHDGFLLFALAAACVAASFGCNRSEPRGDVFGEVVFDGKPVETGAVSFEPIEPGIAPRSITIEKGKYRADGAAGLKLGAYCVRINAANVAQMGQPKAPKDVLGQVQFVPLLPPQWNSQSKLSIKVKPGKNTFDFRGKKGESPSVEIGAN